MTISRDDIRNIATKSSCNIKSTAADTKPEKELMTMSHNQEVCIKAAVAGVVSGGLAFLAVKSLCKRRSFRRMTAAKAFKMIGSLMEAI